MRSLTSTFVMQSLLCTLVVLNTFYYNVNADKYYPSGDGCDEPADWGTCVHECADCEDYLDVFFVCNQSSDCYTTEELDRRRPFISYFNGCATGIGNKSESLLFRSQYPTQNYLYTIVVQIYPKNNKTVNYAVVPTMYDAFVIQNGLRSYTYVIQYVGSEQQCTVEAFTYISRGEDLPTVLIWCADGSEGCEFFYLVIFEPVDPFFPTQAPTRSPVASPTLTPSLSTQSVTSLATTSTPSIQTSSTTDEELNRTKSQGNIATITSSEFSNSYTFIVVISVLSALLCILFGILLYFARIRKRRFSAAGNKRDAANEEHDLELDLLSLPEKIIPYESLKLIELIGEGAFGMVYHCTLNNEDVAVKQLKVGNNDEEAVAALRAEGKKMLALPSHPNVLGCVGIVLEPCAIVSPMLRNGSLDKMLYSNSNITTAIRNNIVVGCARGLAHLHCYNLIHRDLAARNVLLDQYYNPKLCDFGQSRTMDDESYYNQTVTTVGPVRAMAPECMLKRQYSRHSDVYSFGVLLFEIFAREIPWKGKSNMEVLHLVQNGKCVEAPASTPRIIRILMKKMMRMKPSTRPSIQQILIELEDAFGMSDECLYADLVVSNEKTSCGSVGFTSVEHLWRLHEAGDLESVNLLLTDESRTTADIRAEFASLLKVLNGEKLTIVELNAELRRGNLLSRVRKNGIEMFSRLQPTGMQSAIHSQYAQPGYDKVPENPADCNPYADTSLYQVFRKNPAECHAYGETSLYRVLPDRKGYARVVFDNVLQQRSLELAVNTNLEESNITRPSKERDGKVKSIPQSEIGLRNTNSPMSAPLKNNRRSKQKSHSPRVRSAESSPRKRQTTLQAADILPPACLPSTTMTNSSESSEVTHLRQSTETNNMHVGKMNVLATLATPLYNTGHEMSAFEKSDKGNSSKSRSPRLRIAALSPRSDRVASKEPERSSSTSLARASNAKSLRAKKNSKKSQSSRRASGNVKPKMSISLIPEMLESGVFESTPARSAPGLSLQ